MDSLFKWLFDLDNPVANFAPLVAIALGIRALRDAYKYDPHWGRVLGVWVTLLCVGYTFSLRVALMLDVLDEDGYRKLATPNAPNIFLVIALGMGRYSFGMRERRALAEENEKLTNQAHDLAAMVAELQGRRP